jgi:hypothetical protein
MARLRGVRVTPWFTLDTRLGSVGVQLDPEACFDAEAYEADIDFDAAIGEWASSSGSSSSSGVGAGTDEAGPNDKKVNLGKRVVCELFADWVQIHKRLEQKRAGRDGRGRRGVEADTRDDYRLDGHEGKDAVEKGSQSGGDCKGSGGEGFGFRGMAIAITERVGRAGDGVPAQDRLVLRRRMGMGLEADAAKHGGFNGDEVELRSLPEWVVGCAWHGEAEGKEQPKISFTLVPGDKKSKSLAKLSRWR